MPNATRSRSTAFQAWLDRYEQTGDLGGLHLGVTRDELRGLFGEPDDTAPGFRRQPLTGIWRYGIVEFHFSGTGQLSLVFSEQPDLIPRVILGEARNESPNERIA